MGKFKDLRVWQDSINLAEKIYHAVKREKFSKDYALRGQITRAVISISSNLAEGDERGYNKEAVRFFKIAKGSAAEVISQLHIAYRIGYIDEKAFTEMENQSERIRASIKNLIKARSGGNT